MTLNVRVDSLHEMSIIMRSEVTTSHRDDVRTSSSLEALGKGSRELQEEKGKMGI